IGFSEMVLENGCFLMKGNLWLTGIFLKVTDFSSCPVSSNLETILKVKKLHRVRLMLFERQYVL
ncbi:hypothetical protein TELCIR_24041, partial [Teladorsagia circumcincta]